MIWRSRRLFRTGALAMVCECLLEVFTLGVNHNFGSRTAANMHTHTKHSVTLPFLPFSLIPPHTDTIHKHSTHTNCRRPRGGPMVRRGVDLMQSFHARGIIGIIWGIIGHYPIIHTHTHTHTHTHAHTHMCARYTTGACSPACASCVRRSGG